MNEILFISNIDNKNISNYMKNAFGCNSYFEFEVNDLSVEDICSKYPNRTIFLERITLDFYMKSNNVVKLTEQNIKTVLSDIKTYSAKDDERDITLKYDYYLIVNGSVKHKDYNSVDCFLSKKAIGKSSLFFEKYLMIPREYDVIAKLDDKNKQRYTKFNSSVKELMGRYVCMLNDIDTSKLSEYCAETKLEKENTEYNTRYDYGVYSLSPYDLVIYYDLYFQTKGWGDWLHYARKEFSIEINIKKEIETYYNKLEVEKDEKQKAILLEKKKREKEEKETREKQESRTRTRTSYTSSDFDEADYNRRGREGGGWSSEIPGFTNDEVDSYNDRAYERKNGRSRYDM